MCKATTAGAVLLVLLAAGFAVKPAAAQTTQTQTAQGGIEEVIVTATRREEKLTKVPESISAFTAAVRTSTGFALYCGGFDTTSLVPGIFIFFIDRNGKPTPSDRYSHSC